MDLSAVRIIRPKTLRGRRTTDLEGGRRRRDGVLTAAQTVQVLLLLRQVKMPKKLDLDGPARDATARLPGQSWGRGNNHCIVGCIL